MDKLDIDFIFSLGFFLFCCMICLRITNNDRHHLTEREDTRYRRELNEKREFGYENFQANERASNNSRHKK